MCCSLGLCSNRCGLYSWTEVLLTDSNFLEGQPPPPLLAVLLSLRSVFILQSSADCYQNPLQCLSTCLRNKSTALFSNFRSGRTMKFFCLTLVVFVVLNGAFAKQKVKTSCISVLLKNATDETSNILLLQQSCIHNKLKKIRQSFTLLTLRLAQVTPINIAFEKVACKKFNRNTKIVKSSRSKQNRIPRSHYMYWSCIRMFRHHIDRLWNKKRQFLEGP